MILIAFGHQLINTQREWIARATAGHRLFFLGPDELKFFPASSADAGLEPHALEEVCVRPGSLASASKYHFLTSKSTFWLTKTPLEVLGERMLTKVLMGQTASPIVDETYGLTTR